MSSCAIMQPTYLPWSGYFHLASKVETFVFLDDVQFERRSWQSRNNILCNGQAHLLAVPVKQAPQQTLIRDTLLTPDTSWKKKHLRSLQMAYPKLWHNQTLRDEFIDVIEEPCAELADLNIKLIRLIFGWLNIGCQTIRASELGCAGSRSAHLAHICHAIKADKYISPIGSRQYLEEDNFEQLSGVKLEFSEFIPNVHAQGKAQEFVSHLSVIDVIGHCGLAFAEAYVKKANLMDQIEAPM
jgi:hypothetical protein